MQLSNLRILAAAGQGGSHRGRLDTASGGGYAECHTVAGTVPYTSVITEQTLLLSDEQTALAVQQSRLVASVALIEALGGGWSTADLPHQNKLEVFNPR